MVHITGAFNMGQSAPKEVSSAPKEEPSTLFQRQRVDMLLAELVRQFPLPVTQTVANQVNFLLSNYICINVSTLRTHCAYDSKIVSMGSISSIIIRLNLHRYLECK